MKTTFPIFNSHRRFMLIIIPLSVALLLFAFLSRPTNPPAPIEENPAPSNIKPLASPAQEVFSILSTTPANGESGVYPGEIEISFTSNVPITSASGYKMSISPTLPHYWEVISTYPTTHVRTSVYGGLNPNTQYLVTIKDQNSSIVYSWTFTTSAEPAESSSGFLAEEEQNEIKRYFPLLTNIPYSGSLFDIDYVSRLTLEVVVKSPDQARVKEAVESWIKNQGVKPETHKILYVTPTPRP